MKKFILSAAIAAVLCTSVAMASNDNEGGSPLVGTSGTVTGTNTNSLVGNNTNSLTGNNTNNNSLNGANTNNNAIDNTNTLSNVNHVANRNNNTVNSSNTNTSTSSNANNNRNDNVNALDQNQTQVQDQLQGQEQHQVANGGYSVATAQGGNATASGNGSGNSTTVNQSFSDVYRERLNPVNSAVGSNLTAGADTCLGSVTGGVQTQILGVSGGKTVVDENCVMIKNTKLLLTMGLPSAACFYARQDPKIDKAMAAAGVECREPPPIITKDVPIPSAPPTAAVTVAPLAPPPQQIIREVVREVVFHPTPPPKVITKIKYKNKCPKQPTIVTRLEK